MKIKELLSEGLNYPIIVVDVQPEYANVGDNARTCEEIIRFVSGRTGPVLMFINAEDTGLSSDTKGEIIHYWDSTMSGDVDYSDDYTEVESPIDWNRFTIVDKGFGHFRSWMDNGISAGVIIRVIREMYKHRLDDSSQFEDSEIDLEKLVGDEWDAWMWNSPIYVNWTSIAQLRKFNGAYLVGGGRNECLREVELLMNAFNIKYKRIDKLVY